MANGIHSLAVLRPSQGRKCIISYLRCPIQGLTLALLSPKTKRQGLPSLSGLSATEQLVYLPSPSSSRILTCEGHGGENTKGNTHTHILSTYYVSVTAESTSTCAFSIYFFFLAQISPKALREITLSPFLQMGKVRHRADR